MHHWTGTGQPIALAVLPEHAALVVAVRNPYGHTHIVRMPLSGRGDHLLVLDADDLGSDGIQFVSDPDVEQLYWLDGELQCIRFSDYEFRMNHTFVSHLDHPVEMAVLADEVFWTTEYSDALFWAPKHRPEEVKRMTVDAAPLRWKRAQDKVRLLALRPNRRSVAEHRCLVGGQDAECSDVCVPAGGERAECLCAPGRVFGDAANRTCVEAEQCEFR